MAKFINSYINRLARKIFSKEKDLILISRIFNINVILTTLYTLFIFFVIFALYKLLPKISYELSEIPQKIPFIKDYIIDYINKFQEFMQINQNLQGELNKLINDKNLDIIMRIVNSLKTV
ncbi:MAG: hypothetical protein ACOZBL_04730 [Patescibacteria group bacterium]